MVKYHMRTSHFHTVKYYITVAKIRWIFLQKMSEQPGLVGGKYQYFTIGYREIFHAKLIYMHSDIIMCIIQSTHKDYIHINLPACSMYTRQTFHKYYIGLVKGNCSSLTGCLGAALHTWPTMLCVLWLRLAICT